MIEDQEETDLMTDITEGTSPTAGSPDTEITIGHEGGKKTQNTENQN